MGKRQYSYHKSDRTLGYLLLIPTFVVIYVMIGYPLLNSIYLSLTDKVIGRQEQLVGFENYLNLFKDKTYWKVLRNTFIYTLITIISKLILGFGLALLLNDKFRGRTFFRTILLIPWAIPGMVAAQTWRWMYDSTYGIINSLLLKYHIIDMPILWLSNPKLTLYSVALVNIWRGVPFFLFSILGGLQMIDGELYEAAILDGANAFKRFTKITVPILFPVLNITTLLSTIWTFNDFENIYLVTGGGPLNSSAVIATFTYELSFIKNQISSGMAAAVSVIPILIILMIASTKIMKKSDD